MKASLLVSLLLTSSAMAAPPVQESVTTVLGPKAYCDGDVVEITDVTATSPRLEQGDSVTVKGRVRLDSRDSARLAFYLTQTEGSGSVETDATQTVQVKKGMADFTLKITIKHRGALHLTMYDNKTGKPFSGTYFGTPEQMKKNENWSLGYYGTK